MYNIKTGQIYGGSVYDVQRNYILDNSGNETVIIPASQMSEHFVENAHALFQISQEVDFIALEKRESGGNGSIRSLDVLKHKNPPGTFPGCCQECRELYPAGRTLVREDYRKKPVRRPADE